MARTPNVTEIPEDWIRFDDAGLAQSERGIVWYRCKVYRALLDINSASDSKERPLVVRSGRRILSVAQ